MKIFAFLALSTALALTGHLALAQDTSLTTPATIADLIALGEPVYIARCKECHGATGGGFIGPKLSGNARLENAEFVIRQITKGSADMPAFGKRLTPEELLAVGTYVRNSWANSYGEFDD